MKKILCIALLLSAMLPSPAQDIGIKSNLVYDAVTTLSLGAEIVLGKRTTLDLSAAYNPWEFSSTKRMKLWMIQPEWRYWFCESLFGHFAGLHLHGGQFNFSGIALSEALKSSNYQGDFYGTGLSYGYHWIVNSRWGLEATLGAGYIRLAYDKYPCAECGVKIKSDSRHYWGPTKIGINLIYFIF